MDSAATPAAPPASAPETWRSAWLDALALIAGLGMAWFLQWRVRDLVWSLWLSSLLVGYATIVWIIFRPMVAVWSEVGANGATPAARTSITALYWIGGMFLLAFFTVHFGLFHLVHSVFLNLFFPVLEGPRQGSPSIALYAHVFSAYWPFVLVAAVAERGAFFGPTPPLVAPWSPRNADGKKRSDPFMVPYRNVIRMHLLIFFFAFAHFMRLESFPVYAVVYGVYFFPWRLVKRRPRPAV